MTCSMKIKKYLSKIEVLYLTFLMLTVVGNVRASDNTNTANYYLTVFHEIPKEDIEPKTEKISNEGKNYFRIPCNCEVLFDDKGFRVNSNDGIFPSDIHSLYLGQNSSIYITDLTPVGNEDGKEMSIYMSPNSKIFCHGKLTMSQLRARIDGGWHEFDLFYENNSSKTIVYKFTRIFVKYGEPVVYDLIVEE